MKQRNKTFWNYMTKQEAESLIIKEPKFSYVEGRSKKYPTKYVKVYKRK